MRETKEQIEKRLLQYFEDHSRFRRDRSEWFWDWKKRVWDAIVAAGGADVEDVFDNSTP